MERAARIARPGWQQSRREHVTDAERILMREGRNENNPQCEYPQEQQRERIDTS